MRTAPSSDYMVRRARSMRAATSSDNYVPGLQVKDLKQKFAALNGFVNSVGTAWIVSIPGRPEIVFEALETSTLPSELIALGYALRPADPPTGERIVAGSIIEKFVRRADGELEPLTEGSTAPIAETRYHSGICKVLRYQFGI